MVIVEQSDGSKVEVSVIDAPDKPNNTIEVKNVEKPLIDESEAPEQRITVNRAKMDFDDVADRFGIEVAQAVEHHL
ncbi:MAG: hypothetical protein ABEH81_01290 [Halopenitus sp.]